MKNDEGVDAFTLERKVSNVTIRSQDTIISIVRRIHDGIDQGEREEAERRGY